MGQVHKAREESFVEMVRFFFSFSPKKGAGKPVTKPSLDVSFFLSLFRFHFSKFSSPFLPHFHLCST